MKPPAFLQRLMLLEIAGWWLNQMRSMVPAGMLRATSTQPDARIIAIDSLSSVEGRPAGAILLRRGGVETAFAALALDHPMPPQPGLATGLRLPETAMLCREVTLPAAAARNIEAVISFEMDRLTPFTPDELFWGISGIRQDRTHGRINVSLFLVVKAQVEQLLQALRRIGLAPSFIEAACGPTGFGRIDLGAEHRMAARWTQKSITILCGVLALACLATPYLRQQLALDAAAANIAAASPAAAVAQRLRRQLEIAASGQTAIADARRAGDALQVLAILTEALPDGTSLSDLSLKSGDLTFDGRSTDAAALIGRLSAVPGIKDPSFTAPVNRTADGSADEFSLHATVQE